ncbi:MAG: carboxymuconolactone decarboxylase family protein, partial [Pseudomonadota bacterium]
MPHIDPLDRADLPQFEEKFARYDRIRGFLPNSILTMGRRPNIAAAFMELNQAVLYEGTVPEALKMMIALMTSMATGCRYCQGHMANLSHVYEVPDQRVGGCVARGLGHN